MMHFPLRLIGFYSIVTEIGQALANPVPRQPSNLTFAGIAFPDTPSVIAAHQYVSQYYDAPTYNHVMRSITFALLIQSKVHNDTTLTPNIATADPEVMTVAGLLHDLAWNPYNEKTQQFVSQDKRFEVDGANNAREYLLNYTQSSPDGADAGWDQRRVQLVWDSIALHTSNTIFAYKEPEVALIGHGILIDVAGVPNFSFPGVPDKYAPTQQEYDAVYAALPSLGLVDYVNHAFEGLCIEKPATTYDNVVGGWGQVFVPGYTLVGHRFVDEFETRSIR